MSHHEGYCGSTVVVSFLLGTAAGAAAILLLAPQARKESGDRVREFGQELRERATDYFDQAKEGVSSTVGRGKGFIDEKRSLIQSAMDAGKEAYQREKNKAGQET